MSDSLRSRGLHGILQARIPEWIAVSFSKGSPQPRDQTQVSLIAGRCFTSWATREAPVIKNPPPNAGDARDTGLIPGSGRSPGEGNGNPLPYSCRENPMDRGAWWTMVHRVAKSWTLLKWLSAHAHHNSQDPGPREGGSYPWGIALHWHLVCVYLILALSLSPNGLWPFIRIVVYWEKRATQSLGNLWIML